MMATQREQGLADGRASPEIGVFIMPREFLRIGAALMAVGCRDHLAMQGVVVTPILELFFDASADFEVHIWRNSDVSRVEQAMYVAPKQNAVGGLMAPALAVRENVRGFEGRQRALSGYGAAPLVTVCDKDTERTLSQTRLNELRVAEAWPAIRRE